MANSIYTIPTPYNEPVKSYAPGSPERGALSAELSRQMAIQVDIPVIVNGEEIKTGDVCNVVCPHDHGHVLGKVHMAGEKEIKAAVQAALSAKHAWETMEWQERAAVFLKAADLISTKYTAKLNAATMLGQSKNAFQAEIDATCELVDFLRFNVSYMEEIYANQPFSSKGVYNRLEYRPLEGFVFALTPFNFTAIAGNLPTSPAMMGNTVVWKPSTTAVLSNYYVMQILKEAGLPDGVVNFIPGYGSQIGDILFTHKDFAGMHFTGSTAVFQNLWKKAAQNIETYVSYPRIVGETGGKDYIFAHASADVDQLVTGIIRGAFEFQGQKCSACSRLYVPASLWPAVQDQLKGKIAQIKVGPVTDFTNLVNAVIDEKAFDTIDGYILRAEASCDAEVIIGGQRDKTKGYFVHPTVILAKTSDYESMAEEIFGPVLTVYVYEDKEMDATLDILDSTSPYALTGAVFAKDRDVINALMRRLTHTAGNFYINDKPTGAVVGQQPFGGARKSGTNDKAGSYLNLIRWISPRTIKETMIPPVNYSYPFMA
ncbi:L-glutamate gamma-semialdehyde dehydrogenase [uncultured Desulfobacter sp.]|uniref:L-glutamate gamma-semialdehyde dehydrogenase n=1 Tax=uncultured Desulfobacter sp. TaxID=240139 RepID=UPI002AAC2820|nr:L-glutamate gamma-semialdehyde dehydrogenase [uncultured Desulfobacter sp.]